MTNKEMFDEQIDNFKITRNPDRGFDRIHLLQPLISNGLEYAYPIDASPELKRYVHCALSATSDAGVQFDVLAALLESTTTETFKDSGFANSRDKYLAVVVQNVVAASKILREDNGETTPHIGKSIAVIAMARLAATFQSVFILNNFGMFIEVRCLLRFILEQIAYASKCMTIEDESTLAKIEPNKCISELKNHFPIAGEMNGLLSDFMHFRVNSYQEIMDKESTDSSKILTRSGEGARSNHSTIVVLASVYLDVTSKVIEYDKSQQGLMNTKILSLMQGLNRRVWERYRQDFHLT